MNLKHFILKIISSNIDGKLFEDKIRRAIIVNLFTIVGAGALIFYGIDGLLLKKYIYSLFVFSFLFLDIMVFIFHQIKQNTKFASYFLVFLFFILEFLLLIFLSKSYTGLFWFYIFPLFAIFMIGRKTGFIVSILLIIVSVLYMKFPIQNFTVYDKEIIGRFVFTFLIVLILTSIIELVRKKTNAALFKSDLKKSEYLKKILIQSEELKKKKEILNNKNIELEKLSIIAKETKNSILIANKDLKVEWINQAFTNIYGYTLEEYQKKCDDVIICSGNKEILINCIQEKTSMNYVNSAFDKNGRKIWVQTTITPVLDKDQNIIKLIFLESDITRQKVIEREIAEKSFELSQQKEEIQVQKDLLQKKNDLISSYNKAVRESISYSSKIQKSILPSKNIINSKFQNFILFYPKDIVSGDFYWYYENADSYFFASVDCTGHGVPGAFMSIIGIRMLNEIVGIKNITEPSVILNNLHESFFLTLDQEHTLNNDGMDIILFKIKKDSSDYRDISIAGAKRPFIYFDSLESKVFYIKTTRKSIGGIQSDYNKEKFVTQKFKIYKDSIIYLTSDGFIDQHNDKRERIGTAKLLETISKIAFWDIKSQYKYLDSFLHDYMQNQRQTDDILIWGIKI